MRTSPKRSGEFKRTLDYLLLFGRTKKAKACPPSVESDGSPKVKGGSCPLISASLRLRLARPHVGGQLISHAVRPKEGLVCTSHLSLRSQFHLLLWSRHDGRTNVHLVWGSGSTMGDASLNEEVENHRLTKLNLNKRGPSDDASD